MSQKTIQSFLFVCRWVPITLFLLFSLLVIFRIPTLAEKKKTQEAVEQIQIKAITVADVMGKNLPPTPKQAENDATLVGVDVNKNGIRDDIEIALLSATTSLQVRAAELQYVLAKQLVVTSVFNSDTWVAFAMQENRGFQCLGQTLRREGVSEDDLIPEVIARTEYLKTLILNTQQRKDAYEKNMHFITGYTLDRTHVCDVDPEALKN